MGVPHDNVVGEISALLGKLSAYVALICGEGQTTRAERLWNDVAAGMQRAAGNRPPQHRLTWKDLRYTVRGALQPLVAELESPTTKED
jgi:hypothetical protein